MDFFFRNNHHTVHLMYLGVCILRLIMKLAFCLCLLLGLSIPADAAKIGRFGLMHLELAAFGCVPAFVAVLPAAGVALERIVASLAQTLAQGRAGAIALV